MTSQPSKSRLICGGCSRELKAGDLYIEDTASGFVGQEANQEIDGLIADIFGRDDTLSGGAGGTVIFCEDCTDKTREGRYHLQTYTGGDR
jgi:hypothetical protein